MSGLLLFLLCFASPAAGNDDDSIEGQCLLQKGTTPSRNTLNGKEDDGIAWAAMTSWMQENGATVIDGPVGADTMHGGNHIRGVESGSAEIFPGQMVLEIPKRLWLHLDNFPLLRDTVLSGIQQCGDISSDELEKLRLAVAVAIETLHGKSSFYAAYLENLPQLSDYSSFYPRFAESEVLEDFIGLPIMATIQDMIHRDEQIHRCFEAWKLDATSTTWRSSAQLSSLTWPNVKLSLAQVRSRCYGLGALSGIALIPASDLLNTCPSTDLNTEWEPTPNTFFVRSTSKISAHSELFDSYCQDCDNEAMLGIWGIYMEDNFNEVDHACPSASAKRLREATVEMLESMHAQEGLTAPRCRQSAVQSLHQGPLRCSLARLAWEQCFGQPRVEGAEALALSKTSSRKPFRGLGSAQAVVDAIGSSSIHAVHPSLLRFRGSGVGK